MNAVTAHFATRQVYCGAGKIGIENSSSKSSQFQISQRADFMEEHVGLETTMKRPIVNTRDEPHAEPSKYRRLHVIVGDANMCDFSTFLKVGSTAFILAMLEDEVPYFCEQIPILSEPVQSIREISHDTQMKSSVSTERGMMTALNIQEWYLEQSKKYAQQADLGPLGGDRAMDILDASEEKTSVPSNQSRISFRKSGLDNQEKDN